MAPDNFASSSRHKTTARADVFSADTDDPSDLAVVRPSRTGTWASTSPEQAGTVDALPSDSLRVSPQVVSLWINHVMALSDEQRRIFLKNDPRNDVVTYTKAVEGIVDDKLKTSKVVRGTKWIEPLVSFLEMCRPMADALGGLYPPAGLILGGVFTALSLTRRVVKYQEALLQFLMKATSTLGQLNKFRTAFPDSTDIQTGLVDIFDIILQTCAQASTIFFGAKGKEKSTSRLFWKSFEKDFGEWKQALDTSLESFDRTVQLVSGQRLENLHGGQMMAMRVQLETYRAIRKNESNRLQEGRERQAQQLQRAQDERRIKFLAWLSPISFHTTHNSILATTLDETGMWLLQHDMYTSWKAKPRGALLWVYGKHGSGKSHLAARVIEALRGFCQERNAATGNSNALDRGQGSTAPLIADTEGDLVVRSSEDDSALVLWQEDTVPTNSADNNAWNSLAGVASHIPETSAVQSASNRVALAYIYCSYQKVQSSGRLRTGQSTESADYHDSTSLLSCILKQLYRFLPRDMDIPELTQACFETGEDLPSRDGITNGIRNIIPMFSQCFIVVDGLDECSEMSSLEFETFCNFLASLTSISTTTGPSANVLIFSRPGYPAITSAFGGFPRIEVDKGANTEDISRFIDDRSGKLTKDFASLKEIQGHLLNSSDGMFLWVSLVIDSIKQERTAKKMKAAARNMPRGLHGAYTDALKRIIAADSSVKGLALKALLWATNSKKPLSQAQLLEALAIEEGMASIEEDEKLDDHVPLTKDCADLLVLKDGQYMLLHPSLGDFLKGLCDERVEGLEVYQDLQSNAAEILGANCLTYLKFDAFSGGPTPTEEALKEMLERHPFLEYAAVFWGDHIREALDRDNSTLEDSTCQLLQPQQRRDLIHQIHMAFFSRRDQSISIFPFPCGTSTLHILSIFGLHHLLKRYGITELDINENDGFGNCPLDYASQNGHKSMFTKIVEEHMRRVHDVNQETHRQCKSKSWLMGTIIHQHWTDLMIMLLDLGHSTESQGTGRTFTALHLASYRGYEDMMEQLLHSGAYPDARDFDGNTPLMAAAWSNHLGPAEMLLNHGANVCCCNHRGLTPLHIVAGLPNGKEELAAILLDRGGRIEAKTQEGETPLHRAAAFGSESMISLLLDRGANKNAVTRVSGQTPLILAVVWNRVDAARLLLNRGADIQVVNSEYSTVLHDAAAKDSLETIAQILATRHGRAILEWRDNRGCTALFAAACMGSLASAKRLLDEGADVELADNFGTTPLQIALNGGHTFLARVLVDVYKAIPHQTNLMGMNAMHQSAPRGSAEVVQMLLSWGVEAFTRDVEGSTPLHYAVTTNNAEFVECYVRSFSPESILLRQKECKPLVRSIQSYIIASHMRYEYIVEVGKLTKSQLIFVQLQISKTVSSGIIECLAKWKPELGLWRFEDGDLAIHRAVALGYIKLVEYLCHPEVISEPGANGFTPLHCAARGKDSTIVQCLLEHGADVDGLKSNRPSPLIEALREENFEIAGILLDWKANVDVKDDENWRPLHYAAYDGHQQLTRRLMDAGCELEPQNDKGDTPLFVACYTRRTEIIDLFFTRGVEDITIQCSRGLSYAHISAHWGLQNALKRLIEMETKLITQLDWNGLDPLCAAALAAEPDTAELLLASGASPEGPSYTQRTPLSLAAGEGALTIVEMLLRAGAKVDKMGALLRTPLMWAVVAGHAQVAYHLLKAGANPFLQDELGFSAFDMAVGQEAMTAILSPWSRPLGSALGNTLSHDGSQVYRLLQFLSRTSRITARRIEQGVPAIDNTDSYTLEISLDYFKALTTAIFSFIRAHEAGHFPIPYLTGFRDLTGACAHSRPGGNFTAVPVKKAEILREFWALLSEPDHDFSCHFCAAALDLNYYMCCICMVQSCDDCQHASSVLSRQEWLQDFGRLKRLTDEVFDVVRALRPLRHHDPSLIARVLSHGPCLQNWVSLKIQDYRKWTSRRKVYGHFKYDTWTAWKALDTMNSIICLSKGPTKDEGDTESREAEEFDVTNSNWDQVTQKWREIFASRSVTTTGDEHICGHHCQMYSKEPPLTVDAVLDASGKLTAEIFDFLADKFEAAMNLGPNIMDFLESKRFDVGEGEKITARDSVQNTSAGEGSFRPTERAEASVTVDCVGSPSVSSEFGSQEDPESNDRVEIDIEGLLDGLLVKRNSLVNDGRLTEEEDLILNTAWNMAQAIVYQGTPRPSLKEILDHGEDYCTAPTTPIHSEEGGLDDNAPSSYGTPRSMSLASWDQDVHE